MRVEWTPALAVGISEIDAQHRELFRRADRLVGALVDPGVPGPGAGAELSDLVQFLHEYAVSHFGLEEGWMREKGYPGLVRHKTEHDRFITDLLALARQQDEGAPVAAAEVHRWLQAWLVSHVSRSDAELGRWLAGRRA